MTFEIFGRSFSVFANGAQTGKFLDFIGEYFFNTPWVFIFAVVVLLYLDAVLCLSLAGAKKARRGVLKCSVLVMLFALIVFSLLNRVGTYARVLTLTHAPWRAGSGAWHESNIIMCVLNFFYYVPYGFVLPWSLGIKHKYALSAGAVMLTSAGIEAAQYIFALGSTTIDDFVANSLGGIFGIAVFAVCSAVRKKMRNRRKNADKSAASD